MGKKKMVGDKYGKLTVLSESGKRSSGEMLYLCRCDCGKETVVAGSNLRNGHTKSCGCNKSKSAPVEGGAGGAKIIPIGKIVVKRNIRRKDITPENDPKLADLAESIKQLGILEPLIVNSAGNGGEYSLVAGHRRLAAAKIAGLSEAPAVIYCGLDDRQVLEMQISENLHRLDISIIEQAETYTRMHDELGLEVKDIAQRIGKSQAHVYQYMNLLTLPEKLIGMIDNGDVGVAKALVLCSMPKRIITCIMEDVPHILDRPSKGFLGAIKDWFVRDLDGVSFDKAKEYTDGDDGTVWPACTLCPQKKQVEMFGDIIADNECPDRGCFDAKDTLAYREMVKERKERSENNTGDDEQFKSWTKNTITNIDNDDSETESSEERERKYKLEEGAHLQLYSEQQKQQISENKKTVDWYLERKAQKGFEISDIFFVENIEDDETDGSTYHLISAKLINTALNELYIKYIGKDIAQIKASGTYEDVVKAVVIHHLFDNAGYDDDDIAEWIGCERYPDEPDDGEKTVPIDYPSESDDEDETVSEDEKD